MTNIKDPLKATPLNIIHAHRVIANYELYYTAYWAELD